MEILEEQKKKRKKSPTFEDNKDQVTWHLGLGRFQRIAEYKEYIPAFKEYYFKKKEESLGTWSKIKIIKEFQQTLPEGVHFCPFPTQYRHWVDKWNKDMLVFEEPPSEELKGSALQSYNVREKHKKELMGGIELPSFDQIEDGTRTLAGELVRDAYSILKNVQEQDEQKKIDFGGDRIKKRNYVLGVMRHVSKMTQGKESLNIKKDADKRETAGFLFDLLRSSTAGKISKDHMNLLKESVAPRVIKEQ